MAWKIQMSTGSSYVNSIVLVSSILFMISGMITVMLSFGVLGMYRDYQSFLDYRYHSTAMFLIVVGCTTFIVSIFGGFAAIRNSMFLIVVYGFSTMGVFALELYVAFSDYHLYSVGATRYVEQMMLRSMYQYNYSEEKTELWNYMQSQFHCCGVRGANDWLRMTPFPIPNTCCAIGLIDPAGDTFLCNKAVETSGFSTLFLTPYPSGCYNKFLEVLQHFLSLTTRISCCVGSIQIAAILLFCVFLLKTAMKKDKSPAPTVLESPVVEEKSKTDENTEPSNSYMDKILQLRNHVLSNNHFVHKFGRGKSEPSTSYTMFKDNYI